MPPLSTRASRSPAKDPRSSTLGELDAPFKSTQEAKRKKIILALALLFFLDLLFFLGTHTARNQAPAASPGKVERFSFAPSEEGQATAPIADQRKGNKTASDNTGHQPKATREKPETATYFYFSRLALDRAQLAARQDRLELENIYLASLQANISPSQRQELEAMRHFRQEDLKLQEERISKLASELKTLSPSRNQALF